jgi:hypothetical protein
MENRKAGSQAVVGNLAAILALSHRTNGLTFALSKELHGIISAWRFFRHSPE